MIDVTIMWDDGAMFLVSVAEDEEGIIDAVEEVYDHLAAGDVIRGRWIGAEGVPQEQYRMVRFYERGIRAVMTDDLTLEGAR